MQSRQVRLGAQDGLNIEVADGLREGEEIVY
jgi:multidrug efflux pump subunit AcrA (membrane-fusion protein)